MASSISSRPTAREHSFLRTAGERLSCVLDISFDIFQGFDGFRIDYLDNLFCYRFWTRRIEKRTREPRSNFDRLDVLAYHDLTSERCNGFGDPSARFLKFRRGPIQLRFAGLGVP